MKINTMKTQYWLLSVLLFYTLILNGMAEPPKATVPFTANLTFYLVKYGGDIAATQFDSDEMILRAFAANGTNIVNYRNLPDWFQSFDFKLLNDNGQEIPKTKDGRARSKPPRQPKDYSDLNRNFKIQGIPGNKVDLRELFRPDEMFVIANKGVYQLEIRARICVPMTNGVPDTNAMLNFKMAGFAKNCGVIESPPLRVKVIKE